MSKLTFNEKFQYERIYPKISGYTTVYNALTMGYPWEPCIRSMSAVFDEVVVLDCGSTDGTYDKLEKLGAELGNINLVQIPWEEDNPTKDGDAKSMARSLCANEFLWQQDLDEVIHELDYDKIKLIAKRFPVDADLLHLPVAELWGDEKHATGRRHAWKWRMSRNKPEITHGLPKGDRVVDEKTGRVYSKGHSDGCFYINMMNFEMIPHVGFWNDNLEQVRLYQPEAYGDAMNHIFATLPSVWHTSWMDLPNKVKQFQTNWNSMWNCLYQRKDGERFPGIKTEDDIGALCQLLKDLGGEPNDPVKYKFPLTRAAPKLLQEWINAKTV